MQTGLVTGQVRREHCVKQLARKQRSLAAVQDDLETPQSREQELSLQNRAEQLVRDIEGLEEELEGLGLSSTQPIVKAKALDQTLRKIDFSEARRIASELSRTFETQDGGTALLLLQRTTKQMGYNCLYEMISTIFEYELQEEVLLQGKKDGSCKVYKANLASVATGGTELECLKQLFSYEGQPTPHNDLMGLGQAFQKSLCGSLRSGDRVLILIQEWHYVEPQSFLRWFIEGFWKPLIDEIKCCVLPEYGRIKVVAVLASGSQVSPDSLSEVPLYSLDSFNPHHLIDVPLPDWTVEDIEKWFMDVQKLGRTDSRRRAQQLHADSDGTPHIICSMLKEQYSA